MPSKTVFLPESLDDYLGLENPVGFIEENMMICGVARPCERATLPGDELLGRSTPQIVTLSM
jgi:hypothetical protein